MIGTAGTINTGATDDLEGLAALSREEDLWFHVDGAFGALARLVPSLQPIVAGIELADSVAFDCAQVDVSAVRDCLRADSRRRDASTGFQPLSELPCRNQQEVLSPADCRLQIVASNSRATSKR